MKNGQVGRYKFIGEYLVEAGLLTEAQVGVALNDQYTTPMAFGEIIATRGWVKSQTIEYLMEKIIEPERQSLTNQSLSAALSKQPEKGSVAQAKYLNRASKRSSDKNDSRDSNVGVNWIG